MMRRVFGDLLIAALFSVCACTTGNTEPPASEGSGNAGSRDTGVGGTGTGGTVHPGSGGTAGTGGNVTSTGGGTTSEGSGAGTGGSALEPLEECASKPSIDRLQQWLASGEGETKPRTGTLLLQQAQDYVAKVEFIGSDWHVIPVYLANQLYSKADLSNSSGFTLTYSATAAFYVQVRPASKWDGGAQYATLIPATGGKVETHTFTFAPDKWQSLFDPPQLSFPDTLKEATGFVFVGNTPNVIEFHGLRFDGYVPACK